MFVFQKFVYVPVYRRGGSERYPRTHVHTRAMIVDLLAPIPWYMYHYTIYTGEHDAQCHWFRSTREIVRNTRRKNITCVGYNFPHIHC